MNKKGENRIWIVNITKYIGGGKEKEKLGEKLGIKIKVLLGEDINYKSPELLEWLEPLLSDKFHLIDS